MNGQHLRSIPQDELIKVFEDQWKNSGILQESDSGFAKVELFPPFSSALGRLYIGSTYKGYICQSIQYTI